MRGNWKPVLPWFVGSLRPFDQILPMYFIVLPSSKPVAIQTPRVQAEDRGPWSLPQVTFPACEGKSLAIGRDFASGSFGIKALREFFPLFIGGSADGDLPSGRQLPLT